MPQLFKRRNSNPQENAADKAAVAAGQVEGSTTMRGNCPKCGKNPGFEWAVCPSCGHLAAPIESVDQTGRMGSVEVIEPTRADQRPADRARFTEERDFYRPMPRLEDSDEGHTVIERGVGAAADQRTMVDGGTVVDRGASDKTVILRSGPRPEPAPIAAVAAEPDLIYRGPLAFVIERNGPGIGMAHLLKAETFLGRGPESDIVLANSAVSKRHARIRYDDGNFVFWDLASSNFSFVVGDDGERTRILEPLPLVDGQTFDLGDSRLTFISIATGDQA